MKEYSVVPPFLRQIKTNNLLSLRLRAR
jgi:hypothetical protein